MRRKSSKNNLILVDTDVWIGFLLADDPHHEAANKIISQIRKQQSQIVISNAVIAETITVLSHKAGQDAARAFLRYLDEPSRTELVSVPIQTNFHQLALEIFIDQEKRGVSYVDCYNVALMRELELDKICAFDKVYHKVFALDNLIYPSKDT